MKLLDLFCSAGGASMGYHLAGFEVVGVDILPQPNYPFEFYRADALEFPLSGFDAIHASPPCLFATAYNRRFGIGRWAENLIPETRERLIETGLPYIIENVPTARWHLENPIQLCGSFFSLEVQRHRLFESNIELPRYSCYHPRVEGTYPQSSKRTNLRKTVEIGCGRIPLELQHKAMGIDWMNRGELSKAIPPAYTEFLGRLIMEVLR